MKTNFSNQTVSGAISFSFAQMAVIEELLQMAAIETVGNGDAQSTMVVCEIADTLGLDIDIDDLELTAGNEEPARDDMPDPVGQALEETDLEAE